MRLQTDKQPWYKEPWPWILMLGPVVVVIAGSITAWLAVRSNDGLVVDDYYKQGLAINQQLQRDHAAADLGVHAELMHSGAQLRLLVQGDEKATAAPSLTLRITHPTRAGYDQNLTLAAEGHGFFAGKLNSEISGRWHVTLEEPTGKWRLQGEWQADAMEPLRLGAGDDTSTHQSVTGR